MVLLDAGLADCLGTARTFSPSSSQAVEGIICTVSLGVGHYEAVVGPWARRQAVLLHLLQDGSSLFWLAVARSLK